MTDSEKSNLARFAALSDGIFAVIFTIMVLDLRPPPGTICTPSSSFDLRPPATRSVTSSSPSCG
jgi:uncharacterized membrane protein